MTAFQGCTSQNGADVSPPSDFSHSVVHHNSKKTLSRVSINDNEVCFPHSVHGSYSTVRGRQLIISTFTSTAS